MSGCLLLMLCCLTSEFLFLCGCTGGLCSTFGLCYLLLLHPCSMLCQCQILLLLPLFLLLLKLIMIQIVVLLRLIGDQELGYGFTLEIMGHDGIQESTLTLLVLYIRKSREIQPRVLWGLNPKRGSLSRSVTHTGACRTYFPRPRCRRDISLVSNAPIGTGFGPQNITVITSQESRHQHAFLIRIAETIFHVRSKLRRNYAIKCVYLLRFQQWYICPNPCII